MPPRMNFDPHQHLNSGDVAVASNELKNVWVNTFKSALLACYKIYTFFQRSGLFSPSKVSSHLDGFSKLKKL